MRSVPILGFLEYRHDFTRIFSLGISLAGGAAWNRYTYRGTVIVWSIIPVRSGAKTKTRFQPTGAARLSMIFSVSSRVGLFVRAGYFAFIEKDGPIHFAAASAGMELRF